MRRILIAGTRSVAVVSLGGLSALHVLWATGSAWPAPDRKSLADAVGGFSQFRGTGACLVVATLLGLAATSVAGMPPPLAFVSRLGSMTTSLVLFSRGGIGLAGRMPHAKRSRTFAELDRRVYSPVCVFIGLMALTGTLRD